MVQRNLFAGRDRNASVESGLVGHGGGTGEEGGDVERGIDTHTLPCVKQLWEAAVWHRGLSWMLCDDLKGWDGRGSHVYIESIHFG